MLAFGMTGLRLGPLIFARKEDGLRLTVAGGGTDKVKRRGALVGRSFGFSTGCGLTAESTTHVAAEEKMIII